MKPSGKGIAYIRVRTDQQDSAKAATWRCASRPRETRPPAPGFTRIIADATADRSIDTHLVKGERQSERE